MRRLGTWVGWIYTILILAFLLLPIVFLVAASITPSEFLEFPPTGFTLDWYGSVFERSDWTSSAALSLQISLAAAVLCIVLAILVGMAQMLTGDITPTQRSLLLLPLLLPNIILATGLFILALNFRLIGQTWLLVIVNAVAALPIVTTIILAAFETVDPLLWTAARSLGARSWRILRTIIAPILAVAIAVAFVMAFHSAWDETTFAIFIGPQLIPTLPSRMYSYLLQNVTPEIAAVAAILIVITLLGAGLVVLLNRSRARFEGRTR